MKRTTRPMGGRQLLDHHNVISCRQIRSGFFGGMGAFSRKRKPPSDSTLGGAGIAPALWGFATPESTYRASMGVPPRSIKQRTHGSDHRPKGEGQKRSPPEVHTSGGLPSIRAEALFRMGELSLCPLACLRVRLLACFRVCVPLDQRKLPLR